MILLVEDFYLDKQRLQGVLTPDHAIFYYDVSIGD